MLDPKSPEFQSTETFVQFLLDEDRTEFTSDELVALNETLRQPIRCIRTELEGYGLSLAFRPNERRVRGFTTSSNDRWFGPGSSPTGGGAAYTSMMVQKYGSKDSPFGG